MIETLYTCSVFDYNRIYQNHNNMKPNIRKAGDKMGMTNKQFQGFIRLSLGWLDRALQESPDNESLKSLRDIFQSMLEDD